MAPKSIEENPLSLYKKVRDHSLKLTAPLNTEDFGLQAATFTSPPKWHLAHTTWFFEEFLLKKYLSEYRIFHPDFNFLFNSYYDSKGERTPRDQRGLISRPSVEKVLQYRDYVDRHMEKLINQWPDEALETFYTGIHHEQQHQELLLTDIKYTLAQNPLYPVYDKDFDEGKEKVAESEFIKIPAGIYTIGTDEKVFSFDNERPAHKFFLQPFEISNRLITNGEYLAFMEDGGYENPTFWHSDGWEWKNQHHIRHPLYWVETPKGWNTFKLSGLTPMQSAEPITHLCFYEAFAFAEWKKMRLPTETEWEVAASKLKIGLRWEHTHSAYLPYPGYEKPPGAIGEYNGKFMVNQMVLRGHSIATPPKHHRITYRNFFHPHMRWQFTGLRLCKK